MTSEPGVNPPASWRGALLMAGTARARRGRAFSLIELVLVLAIIAVFAAIAVPRYAASVARYRAEAAARRIVADLAFVQTRARMCGVYQTAAFDPSSDTYRLVDGPDLDDPSKEYKVYLAEEPYRADIVEVNFGGLNYMRYDGHGQPYWSGYVVVRAGDVQKKVVVDGSMGRARVE